MLKNYVKIIFDIEKKTLMYRKDFWTNEIIKAAR